jgi:peptidoglycan/xylan/chitin deacetylase (PgdA/CDA1 family)
VKLASLCYGALRASGVTWLARHARGSGTILCYHNVVAPGESDAADGLGLHMPVDRFESQMHWLTNNYDVISLEAFVSRQQGGASLRGKAAITFDDAYAGVFEFAWPILKRLAIPATVFVAADFPGRRLGFWWDDPDVLGTLSPERRRYYLGALRGDGESIVESLSLPRGACEVRASRRPATWQTITSAARSGLQVGAHSATHRSLTELGDAELQRELVDSRRTIVRRTGVTPDFFAYPYGLWDSRVGQAVREAGYRAAFTLGNGGDATSPHRWALPRLNVPAGIGHSAFQAWTSGLNLRRAAPL